MLAAKNLTSIELFESLRFRMPRKTVRDAIGDLPPLRSGERDPVDAMHRAREHRPIALERLRHIPRDGGSRDALPAHLVVDCHRRAGDAFPDSYGRLAWDRPAPTLTGGCTDITRGRYAHPTQDRALTLREAARLQTFPDDYVFVGNGSQIAQQIGNAVPPLMIEVIGRALMGALAPSQFPVHATPADEWVGLEDFLHRILIDPPSVPVLTAPPHRSAPRTARPNADRLRSQAGRARLRDPPVVAAS